MALAKSATNPVSWIAQKISRAQEREQTGPRRFDTRRIDEFPAFSHLDPDLALPDGGQGYSAPVAAANGIAWLAQRSGLPQLSPDGSVSTAAFIGSMALSLGDRAAMSTAPKSAATVSQFLNGLEQFLSTSGAHPVLRYRGLWRVERRFHDGDAPPELDWLTRRFNEGDAVWISIGLYRRERTDEIRRISGHIVPMLGYGLDLHDRIDPRVVICQDCDEETSQIHRHHLTVTPMRTGWIVNREQKRVKETQGLLAIRGGLPLAANLFAAIDSAVALSL
ncbi:MAG: hypothetical protein MRY63_00895 [Neomegalonema sp.]|nr:hypothetical protein [Neomegalonema sp.]